MPSRCTWRNQGPEKLQVLSKKTHNLMLLGPFPGPSCLNGNARAQGEEDWGAAGEGWAWSQEGGRGPTLSWRVEARLPASSPPSHPGGAATVMSRSYY